MCISPSRRSTFLRLTLLAGSVFSSLNAQTPVPAPITSAAEVHALADSLATAGAQPVQLRGVVVDVSEKDREVSIHDGMACVSVLLEDGTAIPDLGSEVTVDGVVFSEPFMERRRTRVNGTKVAVIGKGSLPAPKLASLADTAKFAHMDQWLTVEGTVLQVRFSTSLLTVQLVTNSASCNVVVRDWPRDAIPKDWIGGKVRVSGINKAYVPGSGFLSLVVPSPKQLEVLQPGVSDPFDAPVMTVVEARKMGATAAGRVKLKGTLLAATVGNVFYARADDGSTFSFYMLHPIDEDKSGRLSTPIIMAKCQPGDVFEVVGIPGRVEPGLHLDFGVVRVLESGKVPQAVPSDIATVTAGKHVHDLVELQGRLLSVDDVLVAPGRWRTTMKLSEGDGQIIAFLDASTRGVLTHLEVDHVLRVRGIVTGQPHFPEIRLWIPTPGDLESLGEASNLLTRRLWMGLGIAGVIVVMLTGWVLMLRRSQRIVDELNAGLELRVAERTAELGAAKDELAHALSQERDLHELKTKFVSLVSHEFRTPLGITMSAVEVLRHYRERITPEKHVELLEDIYSATRQMSGLMEQVLLLGRAEAGKLDWRPAAVDLPDLCTRVMEEGLAALQGRCPVNFRVEGDFAGARMDEALLRHIVGNLLSNALKYSAEGSPVDLSLLQDGEQAVITVQDRGIGIPAEDQPKLFEAFQRASNVGETPGTGLGLLLVKHCVELHRGRIELDSKEGLGTTFIVRLPLGRTDS